MVQRTLPVAMGLAIFCNEGMVILIPPVHEVRDGNYCSLTLPVNEAYSSMRLPAAINVIPSV